MIIPKSLLALCGDVLSQQSIGHVYVDVEKGVAVATNGHALVQLPITPEEGEVSGYVPAVAIVAASKNTKAFRGQLFHYKEVTQVMGKTGMVSFPNPFAGEDPQPKYPDYEACVPEASTLPVTISFNAQLMLDLAKTLDYGAVITLKCDPDHYAWRVTGRGVDGVTGATGVIMGCRASKDA